MWEKLQIMYLTSILKASLMSIREMSSSSAISLIFFCVFANICDDVVHPCVCLCFSQIHWTEATMAHRVMQISRENLEELREAFNKIGSFLTLLIYYTGEAKKTPHRPTWHRCVDSRSKSRFYSTHIIWRLCKRFLRLWRRGRALVARFEWQLLSVHLITLWVWLQCVVDSPSLA